VFSNVSIAIPYKGVADQTTQMMLGSNLEILEVASGKREQFIKCLIQSGAKLDT